MDQGLSKICKSTFKMQAGKTVFMLIFTKYNSVWLKQREDLAWREHADGLVPQLDILSSRNVLTLLYLNRKCTSQ